MECVDVVAFCLRAAGEDAANLAAHVSRHWHNAAKHVWPNGWASGAEAAASSLERFRWAWSVGCRWRGRGLMRAAARAGAIDLLERVRRRYRFWDKGATVAAAQADRLDVVEWIESCALHDVLHDFKMHVYGGGPRVREWGRKRRWDMWDPAMDPARRADGDRVYGRQADGDSLHPGGDAGARRLWQGCGRRICPRQRDVRCRRG